ncbi:MAG: ABC transporter substrate-binding protein [Thermoleophilaceae bacterium]
MRALLLPLLAAAAASAVGCQESGFDESKETARPLKVQHLRGESKVPGQAERPATLSVDALDDVLALGVRPVRAAVPGLRLPSYLRERAAGIELMRPVGSADLAALEAADPDLIVGGGVGPALFEELGAIAPTVVTDESGGQWKLNVRLVGEALGRTNDAEALLIDYDRRVARVRRSLSGRPRVAVVRLTSDGLGFASRDSFAATILADAGARRARSLEAADVVLLAHAPNVEVHVDGRFERVDEALWFGSGGVFAARAALEQLQRILHE